MNTHTANFVTLNVPITQTLNFLREQFIVKMRHRAPVWHVRDSLGTIQRYTFKESIQNQAKHSAGSFHPRGTTVACSRTKQGIVSPFREIGFERIREVLGIFPTNQQHTKPDQFHCVQARVTYRTPCCESSFLARWLRVRIEQADHALSVQLLVRIGIEKTR